MTPETLFEDANVRRINAMSWKIIPKRHHTRSKPKFTNIKTTRQMTNFKTVAASARISIKRKKGGRFYVDIAMNNLIDHYKIKV